MNQLLRHLAVVPESLLWGPLYAGLQYFIRSPRPVDPDAIWRIVTRPLPGFVNWVWLHYPPALIRQLLLGWKMRQAHQVGIEDHYDISNAFYELFLDKKFMFYTCADFVASKSTLEDAQTRKADFILNLIQPRSGEQILDLGCGWGGMMRHIVEATGERDTIVGYTLSQAQHAFIRERFGLNVELKNFITCDYLPHSFDKIYSIGAWEHVRRGDLDMLLKKLLGALKPGGRIVHHFFAMPTDEVLTTMLVAQIFFPGSLMPGHSSQVRAFEKAGFRIAARSIHDYRPTLRAWFDNLVANRERALELVGVHTFNKYMVFFPAAWKFFDDGHAMLVRYVLEKAE